MKFETFLKINHVNLNSKVFSLCKTANGIMKKSADSVHGIAHIQNILKNLNFLIRDKKLKNKINFDVLLLAICWHDVWITGRNPTNIPQIIYFQLVEGLKSAKIFKSYAHKTKLDKKTVKKVAYAIRKHSSFQLLPPFTLEATILIDLDKLELWNYIRFFNPKVKLLSKKGFYQKYLVRLYFFYNYKVGLYFRSLDKIFKKNVKTFFTKIN